MAEKARFIRIKIMENGKRKFRLTLPLFLVSFPLLLIPRKALQKLTGEEDLDLKGLIRALIKEGQGSHINVHDKETEIRIELK